MKSLLFGGIAIAGGIMAAVTTSKIVNGALDGAKNLVGGIGDGIMTGLGAAGDVIQGAAGVVTNLGSGALDLASGAVDGVQDVAKGAFDGAKDAVNGVGGFFGKIGQGIKDVWNSDLLGDIAEGVGITALVGGAAFAAYKGYQYLTSGSDDKVTKKNFNENFEK